jgi:hypothetical protein
VRPAEEEYSEEEREGEGGGDDGYDEPPEQGCEVPRTTRVARAAMGARRLSGEVGTKVKDVVGRRVGELHVRERVCTLVSGRELAGWLPDVAPRRLPEFKWCEGGQDGGAGEGGQDDDD